MQRAIFYFRVSTDSQAASGLGLDAQRQTVRRYVGPDCQTVATYQESASGKRSDRPELRRALAHARRAGVPLVVAKLDRIARNAALLAEIAESGVEFHAADAPQVSGAMGRFVLQSMASVAELEAGLIAERTRDALAAARARGVRLGAPDGGAALVEWTRAHGNAHAHAGKRAAADARAESWREPLQRAAESGASLRQIAADLDAAGYRTPRGGRWTAKSVSRTLDRLGIQRGDAPAEAA